MATQKRRPRPNRCGAHILQMDAREAEAFNRFKVVCALEGVTMHDKFFEFIRAEAGRLRRGQLLAGGDLPAWPPAQLERGEG